MFGAPGNSNTDRMVSDVRKRRCNKSTGPCTEFDDDEDDAEDEEDEEDESEGA